VRKKRRVTLVDIRRVVKNLEYYETHYGHERLGYYCDGLSSAALRAARLMRAWLRQQGKL
jgi:hypothetical protein